MPIPSGNSRAHCRALPQSRSQAVQDTCNAPAGSIRRAGADIHREPLSSLKFHFRKSLCACAVLHIWRTIGIAVKLGNYFSFCLKLFFRENNFFSCLFIGHNFKSLSFFVGKNEKPFAQNFFFFHCIQYCLVRVPVPYVPVFPVCPVRKNKIKALFFNGREKLFDFFVFNLSQKSVFKVCNEKISVVKPAGFFKLRLSVCIGSPAETENSPVPVFFSLEEPARPDCLVIRMRNRH